MVFQDQSIRELGEADPSGVGGYSIVFDQNSNTVPASTVNETGLSASYDATSDGLWYFHIRAVDNLDNWGQTAHLTIRVDTTPPSVPDITSSTHSEDLYSNATSASFSWSSTDDNSGVAGYTWNSELDRRATGTIPADSYYSDTSTQVSVQAPPDKDYYFHVRARDNAGNWSDPGHYRIRADMTPPKLTVSSSSHPQPDFYYANGDVT